MEIAEEEEKIKRRRKPSTRHGTHQRANLSLTSTRCVLVHVCMHVWGSVHHCRCVCVCVCVCLCMRACICGGAYNIAHKPSSFPGQISNCRTEGGQNFAVPPRPYPIAFITPRAYALAGLSDCFCPSVSQSVSLSVCPSIILKYLSKWSVRSV